MNPRQHWLGNVRRLVVKVGTGLLTDAQQQLSIPQVRQLVAQLAALRQQHRDVVLVSSGAIGAGMACFGWTQRPKRLPELQAAAAVGQCKLMAVYDECFRQHGLTVGQVLLTHADLKNRTRHLNAKNTLLTLLRAAVIPIINENDTVSVDEIRFGDNDQLGALTAALLDVDLFVILSHVPGLYADRRAGDTGEVISVVESITPKIEALAGGTTRTTSVGGMKSKIAAAKIVTRCGIPLIIASGDDPHILAKILQGDEVGTLFLPCPQRLPQRKRWIAFFQQPTARLHVDAGARTALCEAGRSLLAKGVTRIEGQPQSGDVVSICAPTGAEFARGLFRDGSVIVHRDDLVIL